MQARHCAAPGCERLAGRKKRFCNLHHHRHNRRRPLTNPFRRRYDTPLERLEAASVHLGEAAQQDDDEGYGKAYERWRSAFRHAAEAWCAHHLPPPAVGAAPPDTPPP